MRMQSKGTRDFTANFKTREYDGEELIEVSYSSELAYEHPAGHIEILDHGESSMRLDRMKSGAALLVNHDPDQQVGVIASAYTGSDRVNRALLRFSRSNKAQEVKQDVLDGIRKLTSVGYRIHKEVHEGKNEEGREIWRATDWEPTEISIVAVPADPTVGVGRSETTEKPNQIFKEDIKMSNETTETRAAEPQAAPQAATFDAEAARQKLITEESKRQDAIAKLVDEHGLSEEYRRKAISERHTIDQVKDKALEVMTQRNNDLIQKNPTPVSVDLTEKERQDFSLHKLLRATSDTATKKDQEEAAFELKVVEDAERQLPSGYVSRGVYVPSEALGQRSKDGQRSTNVTTASVAGNLVATNLLANEHVDMLYNMTVAKAAGARILSGLKGEVAFTETTSGHTAEWLSNETDEGTDSAIGTAIKTLNIKTLTANATITRQALMQTTPSVERLTIDDMNMQMAQAIDIACFYGSGSSGQPTGIQNTSGILEPTISSSGAPTLNELLAQRTAMKKVNTFGNVVYVLSPEMEEYLMKTPLQSSGVEGNFILPVGATNLLTTPYLVSNNLSAGDYLLGDFSELMIGEWGGMEFLTNTSNKQKQGALEITMFKSMDITTRRANAFSFYDKP